jgi:hypothetical protein
MLRRRALRRYVRESPKEKAPCCFVLLRCELSFGGNIIASAKGYGRNCLRMNRGAK